MKINDVSVEPTNSPKNDENPLPTSREAYILEVERIKGIIGGLEAFRERLGLSQRRMCQLLMVDPSAWTRWLKTDAPPHIYRALLWLFELRNVNPQAAGPTDLATRLDFVQTKTQAKLSELENMVAMIERTMPNAVPAAMPDLQNILRIQEQKFQLEMAALKKELLEVTTSKASTTGKRRKRPKQRARVRVSVRKKKPRKKKVTKTKVKAKAKVKKAAPSNRKRKPAKPKKRKTRRTRQ